MFSSEFNFRIFRPARGEPLALPVFLSRVAAGFPSPGDDFADTALDLNELVEHPAATFFVRVSGESMQEAGIDDGDLLIVDRSRNARPGDIVVAVADGGMTVKRLQRRRDGWWLMAANRGFAAMQMREDAEIWGVVAHVVKSFR